MNRHRFVRSSLAAAASLPVKTSFAALFSVTTEVSADVNAMTGGGAEIVLKQSAVQDLSDSLRGRLLLRGDNGYDKARRILKQQPGPAAFPGAPEQLADLLEGEARGGAHIENTLVKKQEVLTE